MINFAVTIRSKSGMTEERIYCAENRAALFSKLAADGVSAVHVREAGGPVRKATGGVLRKPYRRLIAFGCAAVAVAAIVSLVWRGEDAVPEKAPGKERVKKRTAPAVPGAKPVQAAAKAEKKDAAKPQKPVDARPPHEVIVEMISVVTNADGSVLERFRTADGKTRSRQSAPRSVFENSTDQLIAMAIQGGGSSGGMPPMPISASADEEFLRSLDKPIAINPDDSEEVKRLKQSVMEVRADIDRLMKEGKTFAEIMREHQSLVNGNASIRKDVMAGLQEYVDKGDMEGAQEYLSKMNDALNQMGMDPVEMPESPEERRQRIREQFRARKEMAK